MHVASSAMHRGASELRCDVDFERAFEDMSLRMTRFVNAVSTAISSGYVARSEARARTLERERAQFGSDLLAGAFPSYEAAHARSLEVGVSRYRRGWVSAAAFLRSCPRSRRRRGRKGASLCTRRTNGLERRPIPC